MRDWSSDVCSSDLQRFGALIVNIGAELDAGAVFLIYMIGLIWGRRPGSFHVVSFGSAGRIGSRPDELILSLPDRRDPDFFVWLTRAAI